MVLPSGLIRQHCMQAFGTLVERANEAWPMRDELCLSQLAGGAQLDEPNGAELLLRTRPIQRALDEIHAAPERDWSIDELSALVGWSNSRFSHVFSAELGLPPRRYMEQCRMRLAQGLLHSNESSITGDRSARLGTKMPITSVAALNIASSCSPSSYRQRVEANHWA